MSHILRRKDLLIAVLTLVVAAPPAFGRHIEVRREGALGGLEMASPFAVAPLRLAVTQEAVSPEALTARSRLADAGYDEEAAAVLDAPALFVLVGLQSNRPASAGAAATVAGGPSGGGSEVNVRLDGGNPAGTSPGSGGSSVPSGGGGSGHAPIADAGRNQLFASLPDGNVMVLLDGSASHDPDSTPGTNDDIVSFQWSEGRTLLGSGEQARVGFGPGVHTVTLTVTDRTGLRNSRDVRILVESLRGRPSGSDQEAPEPP